MNLFGLHLPHEIISVAGSIFGQILHIVKKKTEEDETASEGSIFAKWVLRRPINTIAAALVGAGAAIGLAPDQVSSAVSFFLQAVVAGIAANSVVNRPGDN